MATKKLTVEVDADTSRAKRRLADVGAAADGGSGVSNPVDAAAEKTARSLDKAARRVDDFSKGTNELSGRMKGLVRSFVGIGVGMATSYAANLLPEHSNARRTVGVVGNIVSGVAAGSVAGPWGAVAGGVVGAGRGALDVVSDVSAETREREAAAQAERDAAAARKDALRSQDEGIARTREMKALFDQLTGTESSLAEKQRALTSEIQKREAEEERLHTLLKAGAGEGGNQREFDRLMAQRARNTVELDRLREMEKNLSKAGFQTERADYTALNALARLGGGVGGGDYARQQLEAARETVTVLKSIDQKQGGATWQ